MVGHSLILIRLLFIISAESKGLPTVQKSDVSSENNFAKYSKLSGSLITYTKDNRGSNIDPCGTREDLLLRTTL